MERRLKKSIDRETLVFVLLAAIFFCGIGRKMGAINMINTLMNTSYDLLINTVFYIMAISVLMGAVSELLTEFGLVSVANRILSPLMKPVYDLPGASIIGVFSTYFSDNPAILPLAKNDSFKSYFKEYQFYGLVNLGTAFGMGLISSAFIVGLKSPVGESFIGPVLIGNLGAIIGSIVSTRLMLRQTKKIFGLEKKCEGVKEPEFDITKYREVREGSAFSRFLDACLDGGQKGVELGLGIIPGVIVICSLVQILTFGPSAAGTYTGGANEGVGLLPYLGGKLNFIIEPLFGFEDPSCIAVPITALGAAGASIALIPELIGKGLAGGNSVAVFTAMCMCWSGYLSTHVAMMESLGRREFAGKAIGAHTIGGIIAGISANLIFKLTLL